MSAQEVLNEDWSNYDIRKKPTGDCFFFSCDEQWEIDYLIDKILLVRPTAYRQAIIKAIDSARRDMPAQCPRKTFIETVMRRVVY